MRKNKLISARSPELHFHKFVPYNIVGKAGGRLASSKNRFCRKVFLTKSGILPCMPRKKGSGRACPAIADGVRCLACLRKKGRCHRNLRNQPTGCCCAYCQTKAIAPGVTESQTTTEKVQTTPATKRSRRSPASKTKQDSPIAELTSEKPLKFQTEAARLDAARKRQKKQMQNQPKKKTKANAGKLTLDTKIRTLKCSLFF